MLQIDWGAIDFDEPTGGEDSIDFGDVRVIRCYSLSIVTCIETSTY